MDLRDTIEMMQSEDFRERFKAEYWQTKIRYQKLHDMIIKYEAGMLQHQKSMMGQYLHDLEVRAQIEGVELK